MAHQSVDVQTKSPGAIGQGGGWSAVGGDGTHHGVLADDSDASYLSGSGSTDTATLEIADIVIPPNSRIVSVQPIIRARNAGSIPAQLQIRPGTFIGDTSMAAQGFDFDPVSSFVDLYAQNYHTRGDGSPWSYDDMDSLYLRVRTSPMGRPIHLAKVTYRTFFNERCSVQLDPVADPVVDTSRPTFSWTITDAEDDVQRAYWARIWEEDVYSDPDFSPFDQTFLSQVYWESGEVLSESGSLALPVDLENNKRYRFYINAMDEGSLLYSAPDFIEFSVDLEAPPMPYLAATPDADSARIRLDLLAVWNPVDPIDWTMQPLTLEFQSRTDGGSWEPMRDSASVVLDENDEAVLYHHEAPSKSVMEYRARIVGVVGGNLIAGPWSNIAQASITISGTWLKSLTDPSLNRKFTAQNSWLGARRNKVGVVHQPFGRDPVPVFGESTRKDSFPHTFILLGEEEWLAFDALMARNEVLYFQNPRQSKYVVVVDPWDYEEHTFFDENVEEEAHVANLFFWEVGRP